MSTIKEKVQDAIKTATKNQDRTRLESLRMAKGALLLKEKDGSGALTLEQVIAVQRPDTGKVSVPPASRQSERK